MCNGVLTTGHLANQHTFHRRGRWSRGLRARERERDGAAREKGGTKEGTEKRMNPVLQNDGRRENEKMKERIECGGKRERMNNERRGTKKRHSCRHVSSLSFSNKGAVPPGRPVAVNRKTRDFWGDPAWLKSIKNYLSHQEMTKQTFNKH